MKKRGVSSKAGVYVEIMDYQCCYPDCQYGFRVEGHHIYPLSRGGADEYWNLISLCSKCHRRYGHHTTWQNSDIELFTYKCQKELEVLGFVLDEREANFQENFKKALSRKSDLKVLKGKIR